jgi:hypothetical protein
MTDCAVGNIINIEIYQSPFVANDPTPDAKLLIHNTLMTDCAVGNIINIEIYQLPFVANGPSPMPGFLFTTHYYSYSIVYDDYAARKSCLACAANCPHGFQRGRGMTILAGIEA